MSVEKDRSEARVPRKTLAVEFYVGLFAIAGVAAFSYLAINIAGIKFFSRGVYQLTAKFDNISGLKLGAPVEIAGVQVGQVTRVALDSTSALVTLQIDNDVALRDDDIAAIRTKGIIGDRYIRISPGGSDENIKPGGRITETESAVDVEEIIGKFIHKMD